MRKIFLIFGIIGALILCGAAFLSFKTVNFVNNATKADGVIIKLEQRISRDSDGTSYSYYPVFAFIDHVGEKHVIYSNTGTNPPAYRVNEKVEVLYSANNSKDAQINTFTSLWLLPLFLSVFGAIFFLIGLIPLLIFRKKNKLKSVLYKTGREIKADFDSVSLNTHIKMNGRSPYVINAQWLDSISNTLYQFKSENIWFNPEPFINTDKISVYIDPNNLKKYYVDISFLPKKA